jgi:hypothetical protein
MTTRRRTTAPLIRELLSRPALNGGWEKLARQQEDQCVKQRRHGARLKRIEQKFDRIEKFGKWAIVLLGTIAAKFGAEIVIKLLHP